MSFRKRNVGISSTSRAGENVSVAPSIKLSLPGVRPSPLDGRSVTSTGTTTLDSLLAGHSGLALGSSILLEENGTTDYAGALLKFFAAEGLLQEHHLHLVGLSERWTRELPGSVNASDKPDKASDAGDRMKIAWRYEALGQSSSISSSRDNAMAKSVPSSDGMQDSEPPQAFCHTFDLTKRLVHPTSAKINFLYLGTNAAQSPFATVLEKLRTALASSATDTVHRLVIPSLLSPTIYPPHACLPQHVLGFVHGIRSLSSDYHRRLVVMISLPLSLHPRSTGLMRWVELLCDGVLELAPFPHSADTDSPSQRNASGSTEDPPQGILRIHKLPILHERGVGNSISDDDWTFALSRRKLTIKPYHLPPMEGDTEAQQGAGPDSKPKKADMEF